MEMDAKTYVNGLISRYGVGQSEEMRVKIAKASKKVSSGETRVKELQKKIEKLRKKL